MRPKTKLIFSLHSYTFTLHYYFSHRAWFLPPQVCPLTPWALRDPAMPIRVAMYSHSLSQPLSLSRNNLPSFCCWRLTLLNLIFAFFLKGIFKSCSWVLRKCSLSEYSVNGSHMSKYLLLFCLFCCVHIWQVIFSSLTITFQALLNQAAILLFWRAFFFFPFPSNQLLTFQQLYSKCDIKSLLFPTVSSLSGE